MLTDFGIAKILEADEATLTGKGLGLGTPEYMAPEQWQGKTSPASDEYALGVVLYELLTGQKPYKADTPAAVAILQATKPLQPPRTLAQVIPVGVEQLLYKALAKDPQKRFGDMTAFSNALKKQWLIAQTQTAQANKKAASAPLPAASANVGEMVHPEPHLPEQAVEPHEDKPPQSASRRSRRITPLPAWVLWSVGAVVVLVLLGLGVNRIAAGVSDAENTPTPTMRVIEADPTSTEIFSLEPSPAADETVPHEPIVLINVTLRATQIPDILNPITDQESTPRMATVGLTSTRPQLQASSTPRPPIGTPANTFTPSNTPTRTNTPVPTWTFTPSNTPTLTNTPTRTNTPVSTWTFFPSDTPANTPTPLIPTMTP